MKQGGAVALLFLILIVFACEDPPKVPGIATGGGWFETVEGKVTFGFNGHVKEIDEENEEYEYKGQLQFNDHGRKIKFHGEVTTGKCLEETPLKCEARGRYWPQPAKLGEPGHFLLVVQDLGEPGVSSGDHIELDLIGGLYDPISYDATLGGGNIQIHVTE